VAGAARSALGFARAAIEAELNAGADNPILHPDGSVSSNSATTGGQELAQALDLLAIALTSLAAASERRTAGLLDGRGRLPAFLRHPRARPAIDSGLMIAQYTAAALVAELRARGGAASVQSIPTCPGEDHVSMSALSARHAGWALAQVEAVVAIEVLCACQAADLADAPLSPPLAEARARVRQHVPIWIHDRLLADDIAAVLALVTAGRLLPA
jgi:histidine ammonia-lyase